MGSYNADIDFTEGPDHIGNDVNNLIMDNWDIGVSVHQQAINSQIDFGKDIIGGWGYNRFEGNTNEEFKNNLVGVTVKAERNSWDNANDVFQVDNDPVWEGFQGFGFLLGDNGDHNIDGMMDEFDGILILFPE